MRLELEFFRPALRGPLKGNFFANRQIIQMRIFIFCLLFALLQPLHAWPLTSPTTVSVDAAKIKGEVNPLVFGENLEAADYAWVRPRPYFSKTGGGLWNFKTESVRPEYLKLLKAVNGSLLRYPGGCTAHGFDWHAAVGPRKDRPLFSFGVDEYIDYCRKSGAEPLITVSDYTGGPQDAADLVEYLNAPALAKYPWAMKRAAWGHPQPYKVKYFELGNESDHGNHETRDFKQFTAEQYLAWARQCAGLMRKIDPRIKIGAVTAIAPQNPWNYTVLEGMKNSADFFIVHQYAVQQSPEQGAGQCPPELMMQACMAAGDQMETELVRCRELIRRVTGRDIPLAVTEYNALSYWDNRPIPYQYTLGAGLFAADYLRVLIKPENRVAAAAYWHFANGGFGMVQGPKNPGDKPIYKLMPAFYLYRLWAQHFGTRLVDCRVADSPKAELKSAVFTIQPATASKYRAEKPGPNLLKGYRISEETGVKFKTLPGGVLRASLAQMSGDHFPRLGQIPCRSSAYLLEFEAKTSGDLAGTDVGLGLNDIRGWEATHSGIRISHLENYRQWSKFRMIFYPLKDCPQVELILQIPAGNKTVNGAIEIRRLKVCEYAPQQCAAYDLITSCAALSRDGKKLFVLVFNKAEKQKAGINLKIANFRVQKARRWTVSGPYPQATNLEKELVKETVSGKALKLNADGQLSAGLPPCSMTAFELVSK